MASPPAAPAARTSPAGRPTMDARHSLVISLLLVSAFVVILNENALRRRDP
ncbi:MAG: hypothetical protein ACJLS2_05965 [Microcella pacifica]